MSLAVALICTVTVSYPADGTPPAPPAKTVILPGKVRTPDGMTYKVQLAIALHKDKTFTGTLTYDLGLRQQPFEVEGALTEKGLTFHDKPGQAAHVHPHSPVLAAGTCEATRSDEGYRGTIRATLQRSSPTDLAEIAAGTREAPSCDVTFGPSALVGN